MVSYKELGLVNTREMFEKAMAGKYAIPAFNFNNMEQMQAIIQACVETASPVILQVSSGARKYANQTILRWISLIAWMCSRISLAAFSASEIPVMIILPVMLFSFLKSHAHAKVDKSQLSGEKKKAPISSTEILSASQILSISFCVNGYLPESFWQKWLSLISMTLARLFCV